MNSYEIVTFVAEIEMDVYLVNGTDEDAKKFADDIKAESPELKVEINGPFPLRECI